MNAAQDNWIHLNFVLAADADDNSAPFSSASHPSARPLTSQQVTHSSNVQWLAGTWYALDDMTTVVQAIVNRPGWASGSSLSLIVRGTSAGSWARKYLVGYETNPALAARLVISYQVAASPTATPTASPTPH